MGIQISSKMLQELNMTPQEFLIEMATHFYDLGKMTMGQARSFASIDQINFQKELSKRNINIKYEVEDLMDALKAMETYNQKLNK